MIDLMSEPLWVALIGLAGGILLGLAARLGRFCTLGSIEDFLYGGSDIRLRMWLVAIGVAMIGVHALMALGLVPVAAIFQLTAAPPLMGAVLGGVMFGYGMALCGNCGYGALARLGGGDLRSFVIVVVMGIAAYVTLSGPLAYLRVWAFPPVISAPRGYAFALGDLTGLGAAYIGMVLGVGILGAAMLSKAFRAAFASVMWGALVGLAIVLGWAGTSWVATQGFNGIPVASHSFAAPVGETILFAMTASGAALSFGIGAVAGVWVGAFIGSLIKGHFRWEACEDPRELRRQIIGAAIMGSGAVLAGGCSVGQGITGFSVLSLGAPLTFLAIFAGAALGLRQLITGFAFGQNG